MAERRSTDRYRLPHDPVWGDGPSIGAQRPAPLPPAEKLAPVDETIALNIAYMLYVSSGFIKTFVRLRLAMIGVSIAFIIWAALGGIWTGVIWNVAFGGVHAYQLGRLWVHHRSIELTGHQADVHKRLFPDLDMIDFFTLWSIGVSRIVEPDVDLITEDQVQDTVMLIIAGSVAVMQNGETIATLKADSVIGERSYLTGDRANATVTALEEVTVHEWNQEKIKALIGLCPRAHDSMVRYIGLELANKLR